MYRNRNLITSLLPFLLLLILTPAAAYAEEPPYARWGRLAVLTTKERYPKADIIDYLHVGRTTSGDVSTETFKLWLRQQNKEFGVIIRISFHTKTQKLLHITFEEVSREVWLHYPER